MRVYSDNFRFSGNFCNTLNQCSNCAGGAKTLLASYWDCANLNASMGLLVNIIVMVQIPFAFIVAPKLLHKSIDRKQGILSRNTTYYNAVRGDSMNPLCKIRLAVEISTF